MRFQGIIIDAVTPFDHTGRLYRVKIEHNIGKWNQTSVAGYVVGGVTGEGVLLSGEEKLELWRIAAASSAPGKLLIAGIDATGAHVAAAQINQAADQGFVAALVEAPPYPAEVQLLYFRSVADQAKIPVLISNRAKMSPDQLAALCAHPNIAGLVADSPAQPVADTCQLCGLETTLWSALEQGSPGAILSLANAAPYAAIALWEAHRSREEAAGLDWQSRITPAAGLIVGLAGVAGLKYAMDLNGYFGGLPRLPWPGPNQDEQARLRAAFVDLKS